MVALSNRKRERLWKKGTHVDADDKAWHLSDMTENHLQNTINAFKQLDRTPLLNELNRRKRGPIDAVLRLLKFEQDRLPTASGAKQRNRARRAKKARIALRKYLEKL
jgi:hypothetical protein